ncbi:UNVERIFIED_CONTAM: hypothetical protein NCL1_56969, partial [Trichonephila clavipes]
IFLCQESGTVNLFNLLKRVPGCAKADENVVKEYNSRTIPSKTLCQMKKLSLQSQLIKKMLENGEDINIEDAAETPKTSHSEGLGAVKTALQYFDQQGVSIMDLLT